MADYKIEIWFKFINLKVIFQLKKNNHYSPFLIKKVKNGGL